MQKSRFRAFVSRTYQIIQTADRRDRNLTVHCSIGSKENSNGVAATGSDEIADLWARGRLLGGHLGQGIFRRVNLRG